LETINQKAPICKICNLHKSILIENNHNGSNQDSFQKITDHWILREAEPEKSCHGYLYLEPRMHCESFSSIPPEAYKELGIMLELGMRWIDENFHPLKIYTVTISEAVPHIHFHLVPRFQTEIKGLDYLKLALGGFLGKDR
jgi:diadenosine tetraphosphate (Ap4A) HIT family hydrolase